MASSNNTPPPPPQVDLEAERRKKEAEERQRLRLLDGANRAIRTSRRGIVDDPNLTAGARTLGG